MVIVVRSVGLAGFANRMRLASELAVVVNLARLPETDESGSWVLRWAGAQVTPPSVLVEYPRFGSPSKVRMFM